MDTTYASITHDHVSRAPRTDGWVWTSLVLLAASLAWTLFIFAYALVPDRCEYAQCVRSLAALILWFYPQALAALPTLGALGVLVRYRMRGNTRLPSIGMMIFAANVVLSAALLWYISTLPMEFR